MGYAPGGFPPVGYLAETVQIGTKRDGSPHKVSRWIPDPEKAPLVRRAFELWAEGASYREIHEATGLLGAKNAYGAALRNRTYLGIRKCGKLEIEGAHEPLVAPELFEKVQETFHRQVQSGEQWPKGKRHPRRVRSPFLLSGVARCAYCGAAMAGGVANIKTRPNPWPYYYCGKKKRRGWRSCEGRMINARAAEEAVLDVVLRCALTPAFVEELVEEVNVYPSADLGGLDLRIEQARQRIEERHRMIESLLDQVERYGSESAGARLVQREEELK